MNQESQNVQAHGAENTARLAHGALPLAADDRIRKSRATGVFTSGLSVDEFAVLGSVGFDPVGQVMGSSVYHLGYLPYSCNAGMFGFSGYSARTEAIPGYQAALHHARDLALSRLVHECAALGADGVVGVEIRTVPFVGQARAVEFTALGTAVRARSTTRPRQPFTCDLSGQDFAKLVRSGYIPTGIAYGISAAVRHDDYRTRNTMSAFAVNQEIPGYNELVGHSRHWARGDFSQAVAGTGAEFAVLREMELEIFSQEPSDNHRDHFAIATLIGTGVTQFSDAAPASSGLTMLRL